MLDICLVDRNTTPDLLDVQIGDALPTHSPDINFEKGVALTVALQINSCSFKYSRRGRGFFFFSHFWYTLLCLFTDIKTLELNSTGFLLSSRESWRQITSQCNPGLVCFWQERCSTQSQEVSLMLSLHLIGGD